MSKPFTPATLRMILTTKTTEELTPVEEHFDVKMLLAEAVLDELQSQLRMEDITLEERLVTLAKVEAWLNGLPLLEELF